MQPFRELKFDWDQWNEQKNELKHGVAKEEAESAFVDGRYKMFYDDLHSTQRETRFILFGKSAKSRVLMVGFTIRRHKIRIITARPASRNERAVYEKKT